MACIVLHYRRALVAIIGAKFDSCGVQVMRLGFEEALHELVNHRYQSFRKHVTNADIRRTNSLREALKCTNEGRCIMPATDDSAAFALAADY